MSENWIQSADEPALALNKAQLTQAGTWDGAPFELLLVAGRALATAGERPYLAGHFQAWSPGEVVGELSSGLRTGELQARLGPHHTELHLRDGKVVFGATSNPRLRLGPVLVSHGWIEAAVFTELEPLVVPGRRLGKILTDRGILGPADLYRAVILQVEEIVLDLLTWEGGDYLFAEGPVSLHSNLKLSRHTRELSVESARRQAVLTDLRRRLPREARLVANDLEAVRGLASWIRHGVEAGANVGDLCRDAPDGEQSGLRELAAAVELGALKLGAAPPIAAEPIRGRHGPLETYRRIFQHIHRVLREQTGVAQETLNSFFLDLPATYIPLFEGIGFGEDGNLPVEDVLAHAEALHAGPLARARAMEALEALLAFALFEARNVLDAETAERLLQDVGRLQMRGEL
jgi:hypothetical protein